MLNREKLPLPLTNTTFALQAVADEGKKFGSNVSHYADFGIAEPPLNA